MSADDTTSGASTFRCRATVDGERCEFTGTRDQLQEHAAEVEHATCVLCGIVLNEFEQQVCAIRIGKEKRATCVERLDATLADIFDAYATLPGVVEASGYRMGRLPGGDALVMLADGSMESPQAPNRYTQPHEVAPTVHVEHPAIVGDEVVHPAYVEERVPSDGREHLRDHWKSDPASVLAELEVMERNWRRDFHHGPADEIATVTTCVAYLRRWLPVAARRLDDIDEFAAELRSLHAKLLHTAGLADDPESAPANCFDCGGRLQRHYRPLRETVEERLRRATSWASRDDQRIKKHLAKETRKHPERPPSKLRVHSRATRVRQAAGGDDREGLADTWTCAQCHRTYDTAEYGLALRMRANSITGWVTVRVAAETLRRHPERIRRWVADLLIPSACSVVTRQTLVEWDATKAHSDEVQRRQRTNREEAAS